MKIGLIKRIQIFLGSTENRTRGYCARSQHAIICAVRHRTIFLPSCFCYYILAILFWLGHNLCHQDFVCLVPTRFMILHTRLNFNKMGLCTLLLCKSHIPLNGELCREKVSTVMAVISLNTEASKLIIACSYEVSYVSYGVPGTYP